jgi:hypothetical protein
MNAVYVNYTCDANYNCDYVEMSGSILGVYTILDKWGYEMDTILLLSSPNGVDPVEFIGMSW